MYRILFFLILANICSQLLEDPFSDEVFKNITEIVQSNGYDAEEHDAVTDDGYILHLIRIMPKIKTQNGSSKIVLLQHGLLDSGHTWINNLPHQSLGYILSDHGYEVWLGNSRGNFYSRKHTRYTVDDPLFWDFSWDEMAIHDFPTTLYYILNKTKVQNLTVIGHSQGSVITFAGLGLNPNLQSRINLFVSFAPVVFLNSIEGSIKYIIPYYPLFGWFTSGEFQTSHYTRKLVSQFCSTKMMDIVCRNIVNILLGYNEHNINLTRFPIYISKSAAGTSSKNIDHYAQSIESGKFQMYDYGAEVNVQKYGQSEPPEYSLNNLKIPLMIFYGGEDTLCVPADISKLTNKLKGTKLEEFYLQDYKHLDFVWGLDAKDRVYNKILNTMKILKL